tara:strand:- start:352 stop:792 length:441 start_codon:yes stop_codon:yes gene_type:complete
MITLFEEITYELTDYEKNKLVPIIVKGLKNKHGKANAITNKKMCEALTKSGYEVNGPRLRKVIHHIRVEQLLVGLCSNSKGYYITTDLDELGEYVVSLAQRIRSQQEIYKSMKRDMEKLNYLAHKMDLDKEIKITNYENKKRGHNN